MKRSVTLPRQIQMVLLCMVMTLLLAGKMHEGVYASSTRGLDLGSILQLLSGDESSSSGSSSSSGKTGDDQSEVIGELLDLILGNAGGAMKDAKVEAIPDQTYTGKALRPSPKVTMNGKTLQRGTDYTLTYTNNTKVGTAKCVFKGKGKYTGTKTVSFKIVKAADSSSGKNSGSSSGKTSGKSSGSSSGKTSGKSSGSSSKTASSSTKKLTVTVSKKEVVYTGKAQKPSLSVKVGSKTVTAANYTATYKDNTKVGKATVTVKGKGDYQGYEGTATFKILPPKVSFTSLKAGEASLTAKWKKVTVADGYQVEYCTRKGFDQNVKKLSIKDGSEVSCDIEKLTAGKNYYVRIRAFTKVGSTNWYGEWSSAKNAKAK